jgi:hypothetical protein
MLARRRLNDGYRASVMSTGRGRRVRFEGERMVLIPPPRRTDEIEEHREITWERIAGE